MRKTHKASTMHPIQQNIAGAQGCLQRDDIHEWGCLQDHIVMESAPGLRLVPPDRGSRLLCRSHVSSCWNSSGVSSRSVRMASPTLA